MHRKDFALSAFHAPSPLLTAASEHFPAEHEAMRLMSPICASLAHPFPGGQRCVCLKVPTALSVSEG